MIASMETLKKRKVIDEAFGKGLMARDGINYSVRCPLCKEKKAGKLKLVIKLDDDRYHCWVCEAKGKSVWRLIARLRPDMRPLLAQFDARAHLFNESDAEQEQEPLELVLPDGIVYLGRSTREPDALAALAYLKDRGVSSTMISRWRIHAGVRGKLRRHVFFPSFDAEGKLNYYVARAIDETQYRYRNASVPKSSIIFNEIDIDWNQEVTLVEGIFDALKCPDNCVPLLGSSLSKSSLLFEKLVKNGTKVRICLDSDLPQKSYNIAKMLTEYDCDVTIAFPPGKDLGDLSQPEAESVLREAKPYNPYSFINFKISTIKSGTII
jgi:DNA primase